MSGSRLACRAKHAAAFDNGAWIVSTYVECAVVVGAVAGLLDFLAALARMLRVSASAVVRVSACSRSCSSMRVMAWAVGEIVPNSMKKSGERSLRASTGFSA